MAVSPVSDPDALPAWPANFTHFYEALTGDFRGDVPMYIKLAEERGSPTILDVACGTGRVAIPLAEAGFRVTGVDFDPEMVKLAKAKAEHLELQKRAIFFKRRMQDLKLRRRNFGLILLGADSLAHLLDPTDILATLQSCRNHLDPDGSLFITYKQSPYLECTGKYHVQKERPRHVFNKHLNETLQYKGTTVVDPNFQRIMFHHEFAPPRTERTRENTIIFEYKTRPVFPGELSLLLEHAGLEITARCGDFALSPLMPQSEKLILEARHRNSSARNSE